MKEASEKSLKLPSFAGEFILEVVGAEGSLTPYYGTYRTLRRLNWSGDLQ